MATIRICDRCGETLHKTLFWQIRMLFDAPPLKLTQTDTDYDFCEKCGDEILKFIKMPPVKAENKQDGGNENGKE